MSQNGIIVLLLGLLVGGVILLSKRNTVGSPVTTPMRSGNIALEPTTRYKNKETRNIEWNDDGLPVKITIERDYTIG